MSDIESQLKDIEQKFESSADEKLVESSAGKKQWIEQKNALCPVKLQDQWWGDLVISLVDIYWSILSKEKKKKYIDQCFISTLWSEYKFLHILSYSLSK